MKEYSLILNSNNRVDKTTTSNDATYNFDWSVLDEGEYKITWGFTKSFSSFFVLSSYRITGTSTTGYTIYTFTSGTYTIAYFF